MSRRVLYRRHWYRVDPWWFRLLRKSYNQHRGNRPFSRRRNRP